MMCIEHYRHRLGNFGQRLRQFLVYAIFMERMCSRSSDDGRWTTHSHTDRRCLGIWAALHATCTAIVHLFICKSPFLACTIGSAPRAVDAIKGIAMEIKTTTFCFPVWVSKRNRATDQQNPFSIAEALWEYCLMIQRSKLPLDFPQKMRRHGFSTNNIHSTPSDDTHMCSNLAAVCCFLIRLCALD